MVWSQYVWEASTGTEADLSDDDDRVHDEPLHIDDWIDYNSDELEYLWAILQEYMYDAGRCPIPKMRFEDFARFCHDPQPVYTGRVFDVEYWIDVHGEELGHMWKMLRRTSFLHRTTYETFSYFCYSSR